jgi:hypothetical protein
MRLAEVLLATARAAEAEPLLRHAVRVFTSVDARYGPSGASRARLGEALIALGRGPEGIREVEEGWTILTETFSPDLPSVRRVARVAADYHAARNEPALAAEWRARAGA